MVQQQTGCVFEVDIVTVTTAGTAVQLSSEGEHVQRITFRGTEGNTGNVGVGNSDVSMSSAGWILKPGESVTVDFSPGSVLLSDFFVDADNNGDKLDWIVGATVVTGSGTQGSIAHSGTTGKTATDHRARATQAALEAETDEDTSVSPNRVKFSPGVAKVWVHWEQTDAHGITSSHNMTSVTDGSAAGDTDHLWNTDFSDTLFAMMGMSQTDAQLGFQDGTLATTGVTTRTFNAAGVDADRQNMMSVFGDQ